ncbi:MAG: hypothetical protein Q9213_008282, partial [Squamulea squamosa]
MLLGSNLNGFLFPFQYLLSPLITRSYSFAQSIEIHSSPTSPIHCFDCQDFNCNQPSSEQAPNEKLLAELPGAINPTAQARSTATMSAHESDKTKPSGREDEQDARSASPITESVHGDFDAYGTLHQTLDLIDSLGENEAIQRLEEVSNILDIIDCEGEHPASVRSRVLELDEVEIPTEEEEDGRLKRIKQTGYDSDFFDCPSELEENKSRQNNINDNSLEHEEAGMECTRETDSADFPRDQYTPEPYTYDTPSEREDNETHWHEESTIVGTPSVQQEEEEDGAHFDSQLALKEADEESYQRI